MTGSEVTAAMKAEDVPAELVEKAADAMADAYDQITQDEISTMHQIEARAALAAVLPEVRAQAHRAGYEMARADMVSGGFIGGPTYEALRDSFTGRQIAQEALERAANEAWMNRHSGASDALRKYAARLTTTTEEPK
jgi:hypothetical protein